MNDLGETGLGRWVGWDPTLMRMVMESPPKGWPLSVVIWSQPWQYLDWGEAGMWWARQTVGENKDRKQAETGNHSDREDGFYSKNKGNFYLRNLYSLSNHPFPSTITFSSFTVTCFLNRHTPDLSHYSSSFIMKKWAVNRYWSLKQTTASVSQLGHTLSPRRMHLNAPAYMDK